MDYCSDDFRCRTKVLPSPSWRTAPVCFFLCLFASTGVFAAWGETQLVYNEGPRTLTGFSVTAADWELSWPYYFFSCQYDEGLYLCEIREYFQVEVDVRLDSPSGVYLWDSAQGLNMATFNYPLINLPAGGGWYAWADHYVRWNRYNVVCEIPIFGFCSAGEFIGQIREYIFTTTATENVPPAGQCAYEASFMAEEYLASVVYIDGVPPIVECDEFEYHESDYQILTDFEWGEVNGGFSGGNPHYGWGHFKEGVLNKLQATRDDYGMPIVVISGYRCPHGNQAEGGEPNSKHMQGEAFDLYKDGGTQPPYWTLEEFNELKADAEAQGVTESLPFTYYSNRHYHVAFSY